MTPESGFEFTGVPMAGPTATDALPEPATERGRRTRRKLLDAAEGLFGRKGFHATSVVEITQEAGVGHGTFYLYFRTKEEIFRELVRALSHALRSTIARAVEGVEDRLEVEEIGIRSFIRFSVEHRELYRIVFESQFIDPAIFRWYYERLADGYAAGLAEAMEEGQIRRLDPKTLAYCLMGASHFLGMRWVLWEAEEPPEEAVQTLLDFIRPALRPEGWEGD